MKSTDACDYFNYSNYFTSFNYTLKSFLPRNGTDGNGFYLSSLPPSPQSPWTLKELVEKNGKQKYHIDTENPGLFSEGCFIASSLLIAV